MAEVMSGCFIFVEFENISCRAPASQGFHVEKNRGYTGLVPAYVDILPPREFGEPKGDNVFKTLLRQHQE